VSALQPAALLRQWRCRHPLWLLWVIALIARLPAAFVRFVIGTDEGLFLTLGRNLLRGLGYTANGSLVQVDFPPGFSFFAAAVYALGGAPELPSRLNVVLIGSLLPLPVYVLARALAGEPAAFRAGLLTALLPALVLAQGNFEAVAEPLYTLLLFTAWALLATALHRYPRITVSGVTPPRPHAIALFALAGLGLGAAHLVRWEGVVLALVAAGMLTLRLRRRALAPLAAFALAVALFAAPYAAYLHRHTGSAVSPKAVITRLHAASLEANRDDAFAYEKAYLDYEAYLRNPRQPPAAASVSAGALAARYLRNAVDQARLWLASVSLMTPLWLLPAVAGGFALPRRRALFLAALFVPLLAIPASVVDPRYFLPVLPAAMIFVACGLTALGQRWRDRRLGRLARLWLAVMLAAFALGSLAGPFLFPRPLEYRAAGLAVQAQLPEGAHMLARKRQVPFYAGAFWEWLPYGDLEHVLEYARGHNARYLVLDEATTPWLRPQLAHLLDPAVAPAGLVPIYARDGVVIYALEP
jgi:4-amino-4-deoxy-L-arabinose transferase-like glycosyltransferase